MKITIDTENCIGCNMCGAVSNGVIAVSDSGKAAVNPKFDLNDPVIVQAAKLAAQSCPTRVITVED
jgi:ferredoxin